MDDDASVETRADGALLRIRSFFDGIQDFLFFERLIGKTPNRHCEEPPGLASSQPRINTGTKQSRSVPRLPNEIASRSLSSGGALRGPGGSQ